MLQPIGGEPLPRAAPDVKRTLCKFFLSGTCGRGDLCTWAHGEHELGEPIGGLFDEQDLFEDDRSPVGFAGDSSMGPNAKRTICKFWQQGVCKRGLDCTFAHGVEDMQVDVQDSLFDDLAVELLAGAPAGTKRTICKFWEEDACTKGDSCTFAHGPEELGALIPGPMEPVFQGPGTPIERLAPIGSAGHASMAPAAVKRTICKFWEQGTCTRGIECTWAHGEEDLGAPVMEPLELSRPAPRVTKTVFAPATTSYVPAGKGTKGPIGKSVFGQKTVFQRDPLERFEDRRFAHVEDAPRGKGRGTPIGLEGGKGAVEQPVKKTLCKFWLDGQCTRGQDCTWAHGVEEQAVPVHMALGGIPSGPPAPGPAEVRRTICKFWQQGKCTQAAGQCTWAHGEWEIGTQVGTVSNGGGYHGGSIFKRPRLI